MQIGVTGTCKKNEPYRDAINRELKEELGLRFDNIRRIKKKRTVQYFKVNVTPDKYSTIPFMSDNYHDTVPDKKGTKVVGIVYGDLDTILDCMRNTKLPKHWLQGEDISHICTIKIDIAISMIKTMMKDEFMCNGNHLKGCKLIHKKRHNIIV